MLKKWREQTSLFIIVSILLVSGVILYRTFAIYKNQNIINENDIESYFVWIPRYEYQIWINEEKTNEFTELENLGVIDENTPTETLNKLNQAKEIKIRFVTNTDAVHDGSKANDWLTHPAFTSFNNNGFWAGKFETSKSKNAVNNSISPESVQIKPGVSSWREIKPANAFYTTYSYQRELDSHMMKNTEWGAVAYFTNSKYGRCDGNGKYSEVRINNNNDYITGSSAVNSPTCGYTGTNIDCNKYGTDPKFVNLYNNPDSVASSTTNNYYGIFDIAGGAGEYVMGVMLDESGKPVSGRHNIYNSGFVGTLTCSTCGDGAGIDTVKTQWTTNDGGLAWPDPKYYDAYIYDTSDQSFQRGFLGDGTKELKPFYEVQYKTGTEDKTVKRPVNGWNANFMFFADKGFPWISRGGYWALGTDAGIFAFDKYYGQAAIANTFRVILTP